MDNKKHIYALFFPNVSLFSVILLCLLYTLLSHFSTVLLHYHLYITHAKKNEGKIHNILFYTRENILLL